MNNGPPVKGLVSRAWEIVLLLIVATFAFKMFMAVLAAVLPFVVIIGVAWGAIAYYRHRSSRW